MSSPNPKTSTTTTTTSTQQRRPRRGYIPIFVAAILLICVVELEEFQVGWKELSTKTTSQNIYYIRSNYTTTATTTTITGSSAEGGGTNNTSSSSSSSTPVPSSTTNNITGGSNETETNPFNTTTTTTTNTTNTTGTTDESVESPGQEGMNTTATNTITTTTTINVTTQEPVDSISHEDTNITANTTTLNGTMTNETFASPSSDSDPNSTSTTETPLSDSFLLHQQICSKIPPGMSVSKIWQDGLSVIEQGLQHPLDTNFTHRSWTHALLHVLPPFLLKASVRAQPAWQLAVPMLVKLAKHLQDPIANPPLKIVVMGGSVPEGVQCARTPWDANPLPFRRMNQCPWPIRLNLVLDHVFRTIWNTTLSPIEIKNIATGGTNTAAATHVVEYWLNEHFQSSASEGGSTLDMIINGYAANDNIPDGKDEVDDVNTTLSNYHYFSKLDYALNFARKVANMNAPPVAVNDTTACHAHPKNHGPPDPLLLFLNDYYGNLQLSVMGEGQRNDAIQWLTDMHDHTGYVSPPHSSILRWIWADIYEDIFSGVWMKNNVTTVNVHYGMSGHVVDAIFIAYYFLHLGVDVCEQVAVSSPTNATETTNDSAAATVTSVTDLFSNGHAPDEYLTIDAKAITIQETSWTTFATISHTCETSTMPEASNSTTGTMQSPCVFAFLTAAMGSHKTVGQTNSYLKPFTKFQQGWSVENDFRYGGFQNKMGLVANGTNATMVLATTDKTPVFQPVKFVTVYYLKSYGDGWKDSRAQFDVEVFGPPSDTSNASATAPLIHSESFTLEGFHDQQLSTNYIFKQELGVPVPVGGSMQLTMTLVSGTQFKIIAIMWCIK